MWAFCAVTFYMSFQNPCTLQNCPTEVAGLIGKSETDPTKPVQVWGQSTERRVVAAWAESLDLPDGHLVGSAVPIGKRHKKGKGRPPPTPSLEPWWTIDYIHLNLLHRRRVVSVEQTPRECWVNGLSFPSPEFTTNW